MADRKKVAFIARFIILWWIAIAAFVGIVAGLGYVFKSAHVAVMIALALAYSCAFGFLGWQRYKEKHERGVGYSAKDNRGWGSLKSDESDSEEIENGWH
jgi:hypothetical protein